MATELEVYLQQIGLVAELLLSNNSYPTQVPSYVGSTSIQESPGWVPKVSHAMPPDESRNCFQTLEAANVHSTGKKVSCDFSCDSAIYKQPNDVSTVTIRNNSSNRSNPATLFQDTNVAHVTYVESHPKDSNSTVIHCSSSCTPSDFQVFQVPSAQMTEDTSKIGISTFLNSSINRPTLNANNSCLLDIYEAEINSFDSGEKIDIESLSKCTAVFKKHEENSLPSDLEDLRDLSHDFSSRVSDTKSQNSEEDPGVCHIPVLTDSPLTTDQCVSESTGSRPEPIIKSSMKKTSPGGARKSVKFSTSDLVHVEEYTISPGTPQSDLFFPLCPSDLFLPPSRQLDDILDHAESDLEIGQEQPDTGNWFDASTDADPYLADFPSPEKDQQDSAPLSFVNDVFGRTTIFVTSGTFRPGDSGKFNGKTVTDLSGSHGNRRMLSTGTLSSIKSHRTLVKVDFIQGLLDINHNPGQTAEIDSKATQNTQNVVSFYRYAESTRNRGNSKNFVIKEYPRESVSGKRIKLKICHELSHHKHKLIIIAVGGFLLLIVALSLGLGLGLGL